MKVEPQTHCLTCNKPSIIAVCDSCSRRRAMAIRRKYTKIFDAIKARIYANDKEDSHKAACEQIRMLAAYDKELHATGWRNRDLDVDGSGRGVLIKITAAWRKKERDRARQCLKSMELLKKGDYDGFWKLEKEIRAHWYDNPDAPEKK